MSQILARTTSSLLERLTPATITARLGAMATLFNLKPSLRHHLRDTHPSSERYE